MDYYIRAFKHFADIEGRDTRKEYWMFFLINTIIGAAIYSLAFISLKLIILYLIYWLLTIVPSFSIAVRRLHDLGMSGFWIIITLIPLLGSFILLIILAQKGQQQDNKYGPYREA